MSENPYAPPSSDLGSEAFEPPTGGGELSIGRCLSEGWERTWSNFPTWLGVGFVGVGAMLLAMVSVLGIFLAVPVLTWGVVYYLLRAYDGQATFGDLFAGFSVYGQALGAMLGLLMIIVFVSMVGQSVQLYGQLAEDETFLMAGLAINLVFSLLVVPRVSLAYFYVVDQGCGPVEAVQSAWAATSEAKLQIVLLILVSYLIIFAGILALGIGFFPASMMTYLMWASAYRQFAGAPAHA